MEHQTRPRVRMATVRARVRAAAASVRHAVRLARDRRHGRRAGAGDTSRGRPRAAARESARAAMPAGAPIGTGAPHGGVSVTRRRAVRVPAWQAPLWALDGDGEQLALLPDPRDVDTLDGTAWDPRPRLELVTTGVGRSAEPVGGAGSSFRPRLVSTPGRSKRPTTGVTSRGVPAPPRPNAGCADGGPSGDRGT